MCYIVHATSRRGELNHSEQMGWLVGAVGIELSKPLLLTRLTNSP